MTELIIAEKPSAAKKIAEALADKKPIKKMIKTVTYYELTHNGKAIIVGCAVGHLYTLAEKEKSKGFIYPIFDVAWTPTSDVSKGADYTKDYVQTLKKIAKEADTFTVACDFDTEGSLIGLNVIRYACEQKDARRMKFSTLTKPDLVEAYAKVSPHLDWGQAIAGETRHFLDFFYGINISRALTSAIKSAGLFKILSTGRVQGPALKIIVDREREISAFKATPFWEIELLAKANAKATLLAQHSEGKFWDESTAKAIFDKVQLLKEVIVSLVEAKQFKQSPPNPFDLTTLQTEAYRVFGISPKETLEHAQSLYLAGVISYPRTSSQQYPEAIGFKSIIKQIAEQKWYADLCAILLGRASLVPNNGKKTDPAHPAIYPTGIRPGELKAREAKIYDLIVKRFLATFGDAAVRETVTVSLDAQGDLFIARGTRTVQKNWHVLYEPYVKLEEEELPTVQKGDCLPIEKVDFLAKETSPPKRFTPASLIKELERQSLGTKATRSEIVDTLYRRNYIADESIRATELGIQIIDVLHEHVPKIIDVELTKKFEADMEGIREQKKEEGPILEEAKHVLTEILAEFKSKEKTVGEGLRKTFADGVESLGVCPRCKVGHIVVRRGKFGRFAACNKYPDCKTTFKVPPTGSIKQIKEPCVVCLFPMIRLVSKGKRPVDLCLNPDCPSKNVVLPVETTPCTKCNKGTMVVRKSVYGAFLACDQYPTCKNTKRLDQHPSQGAPNMPASTGTPVMPPSSPSSSAFSASGSTGVGLPTNSTSSVSSAPRPVSPASATASPKKKAARSPAKSSSSKKKKS